MAYVATADVPAGSSAASKAAILALVRDAYSIKSVSDATARAQAVTDWPTLTGAAVSASNPVMVYRQDTDCFEASENGTTWSVYAPTSPTMQIVGGKAGAMTTGAVPIIKVDNVALTTNSAGVGSFTFDAPFPTACAAVFAITTGGTAVAPVINLATVSASGASLIWSGVVSEPVTFYYLAIGW